MKKALRDSAPAAAFTGGLALACYGLSLAWSPLGYIAGGALLTVGSAVYEWRKQAAAAHAKARVSS